jgi:hypothetical protein
MMKNTDVAVTLALGLALLGCVRSADAQVDPCALLTIAEVQQALPGSKPGTIERGLEKQGILRCSWSSPGGLLFLVASKEPEDSAKAEASGWVDSFVDPLRADARGRVRFDTIAGVGDEAVAVVERQDKPNGINEDGALIVIRRGTWQVSLLAPKLAQRERADALRALTELGKAVARRLN